VKSDSRTQHTLAVRAGSRARSWGLAPPLGVIDYAHWRCWREYVNGRTGARAMRRLAFCLLFVLALASASSPSPGQRVAMPAVPLAEPYGPFSKMLVFGDSLSDVGNVHLLTGGLYPESPPYYQGRFSNGPVWSEITAERLGVGALSASLSGGTCCAYGGAETGYGLSSNFTPNLGSQIAAHLSGQQVREDQLIVVWGGANDFLAGGQTDPAVPVANLVEHVTTLAAAGGEVFLVPNLPPLGKTPAHRGQPSEAVMDQLSTQFNTLLEAEMDALAAGLGITVLQMDVQAMLEEVLARPAAFGFANVTDRALVDDTPAPNAEEYLFWDEVHPTGGGHDLLAGTTGPWYPGDIDGDARVNAADYLILKAHLVSGSDMGREDGDLDGDADVDRDDLALLRENFGHALGTSPPVAPACAPEPTAAALLALGTLLLASAAGQRRQGSRIGRVSQRLASSSPGKTSRSGSHLSARRVQCAMQPRWETMVDRQAIDTSQAGRRRVRMQFSQFW